MSYLADIAEAQLVQGSPDQVIHSVGPIADLKSGFVGFARNQKHLPPSMPNDGVIVVDKKLASRLKSWAGAVLVHEFPVFAFIRIANFLVKPKTGYLQNSGNQSGVSIHSSAVIAPGVIFGEGAKVGRNSCVGANTTIGAGVSIGDDCEIGAGVHISFADIGDRVHISSGAVIGGRGFGTDIGPNGLVDIAHFGTVHIADNVTIGSNTTIDRGVFKATFIGAHTKIDNLVQIGHNVQLGENCVLAAHTGISGSVEVGDRVLMGGKVGITEHVKIGSDSVLFAGSSLIKDMPANETWSGTPAQPFRQHMREIVAVRKLAMNKTKKNK